MSCKSDCHPVRLLIRSGTASVLSILFFAVLGLATGSVSTVSAQSEIFLTINAGGTGGSNSYTSLLDLRNSALRLGAADSQTILLSNNDSTLTGSPLRVSSYRFPGGTQSVVTLKSDSGTARTVQATDARVLFVHPEQADLRDWPIAYHKPSLVIEKEITISGNRSDWNTGGDSGGVVVVSGDLTADGVTFKNNVGGQNSYVYTRHNIGTNIWTYNLYYSTFGGGALFVDGSSYYADNFGWIPQISVKNALFDGNSTVNGYNGGAVYFENAVGDFSGSTFTRNTSTGRGGGLFLSNSTVDLSRTTFSANAAAYSGGGVHAEGSHVNLKGASFLGNQAVWNGGAVTFDGAGKSVALTLGAFEGQVSRFEGNWFDNGGGRIDNGVYLTGVNSRIDVNVDVERFGTLNMQDPMQTGSGIAKLHLVKTGEGTWILGGANQWSATEMNVDINAGTFNLTNDASLWVGGSVDVASGAILETGGNSVLSVHELSLKQGSTLQTSGNTVLGATRANLGGTLTGTGNLTLYGGTVTVTGTTDHFGGDLTVGQYTTLNINSEDSFDTTGDLYFQDDTILGVMAGGTSPIMKADQISIGSNVNLILNGIHTDSDVSLVVLEANNAMDDNNRFANEGSFGSQSVDYLSTTLGKSADKKQYLLTAKLTWNLDNANAHGRFTVEQDNPVGAPGEFVVTTSLTKQSPNPAENWNGEDLSKAGSGILELAAQNDIGDASIEGGTLRLTHSKAIASTETVYFVPATPTAETILELHFKNEGFEGEHEFATKIDGGTNGVGKVLKTGDSVIQLTNSSNNYAMTEIQGGVLVFQDQDVLGNEKVVFSGGQLRYANRRPTGSIDRTFETASADDNIRIDTAYAMRYTGTLQGDGGLVKTGKETLTLAGTIDYLGDTVVKEGVLILENASKLADPTTRDRGALVIADGATLRNSPNATSLVRNVVVEGPETGKKGSVIDVQNDLTLSGNVSGNGLLVKKGVDTVLTLTGHNTSTGGLRIDEGTVSISQTAHLGEGELIFNGGTLRTTAAIDDFNKTVTSLSGQAVRLETREDLTVLSSIGGNGGLVKTGEASLILKGIQNYTGATRVEEGRLIVDGKIYSDTSVAEAAVLRGTGTIVGDVSFEAGSCYEWYCDYKIADTGSLHVLGSVTLNDTVFRPVTAGGNPEFFETIDGRVVLAYGALKGDGQFTGVDNSLSPFFDFDLDYSESGFVKVVSRRRDEARGLSDGIALGLTMAQRRAHRRPFDRIDHAFRDARFALEPANGRILNRLMTPARPLPGSLVPREPYRGQQRTVCRDAWGEIYGRSSEFESTHFDRDWKLNSFGFQAGYSFRSTPDVNWGLTFGTEFPELKNGADKIEMSEFFVGAYYGQRFWRMLELKGYLGGGSQRYKFQRHDALYGYHTRYYGESFQANVELARPFRLANTIVRPLVGFDLEYAQQQSSVEESPSVYSEYRAYSRASLTQLYVRVGLDLERRFRNSDGYFGIAYSNMIGGDSVPNVGVYYPTAKLGGTIHGSNLGQNIFTFRLGGNVYLRGSRSNILFWNFTADNYADRDGGKGEFSGSIGYSRRF